MSSANYTCIVCPVGCRGVLTETADGTSFTGFKCKQGEVHAQNEHICPKRVLTTTVVLVGAQELRVPVVSDGEIEKSKLFDCLKYLYACSVCPPIREGQIIIENILNTGVNIIAARDVEGERIWTES